MFGKDSKKPEGRIDTLIGAGTVVEGNISLPAACASMAGCAEMWHPQATTPACW